MNDLSTIITLHKQLAQIQEGDEIQLTRCGPMGGLFPLEKVNVTEVYRRDGKTHQIYFFWDGLERAVYLPGYTRPNLSEHEQWYLAKCRNEEDEPKRSLTNISMGGMHISSVQRTEIGVFPVGFDYQELMTANSARESANKYLNEHLRAMTSEELWDLYYVLLPSAEGHGRVDRFRPLRTLLAFWRAGKRLRVAKNTAKRSRERKMERKARRKSAA